jgi:hypothetical protein
VRALLWPLFPRSAWDQPATVLTGTTGEGAALASVHLVGVGSASHSVAGTTVEGAALASVLSVSVGSGDPDGKILTGRPAVPRYWEISGLQGKY